LVWNPALCGFRELREAYKLFEELAVTKALELVAPLVDAEMPAGERLRVLSSRLLRLGSDARSVILDVARAAGTMRGSDGWASLARTAHELNATTRATQASWPLF
jgi:hypothetical protein